MSPLGAAGSGAGLGFLLAVLNGWLASRRSRSSLFWFVVSLILSPVALLLTLYLLAQPRSARGSDRAVVVAAVGVWVLLLILLLSVGLTAMSAGHT